MTSKSVALLLSDLGVVKTHSRPYVSDDNPYSESHFKTLKYRPGFPDRFGSLEEARRFCQEFFSWYNQEPEVWPFRPLPFEPIVRGLFPDQIPPALWTV